MSWSRLRFSVRRVSFMAGTVAMVIGLTGEWTRTQHECQSAEPCRIREQGQRLHGEHQRQPSRLEGSTAFAQQAEITGPLAAAVRGAAAHDGEPSADFPADRVIQRFNVAKGGDALLLPVRYAGREHSFWLDTGSERTCFDSSLPLGKPTGSETLATANGVVGMKLYDPPADVFVGGIPFRVADPVGSFDMREIREASGWPIEGVLGMDFLAQHVLHIDYDKGEVIFLKSTPRDSGAAIQIDRGADRYPSVDVEIAGKKAVFLIDTGAISFTSGNIELLETADLFRQGEFRAIGSNLVVTAAKVRRTGTYVARRLRLGEFTVERPMFQDTLFTSALGSGFWSRFVVTFDFPGGLVYLRKGERFNKPDRRNSTGLHLRRRGGDVILSAVDEKSPGARSGAKPGDLLLILDGLPCSKASLFELRSALCKSGPIQYLVRRGAREHPLTIDESRQVRAGLEER